MNKLLIGAVALALSATAALAQQTVRMGTEGAYPPYNFINDNGQVDGFERELGDELCKRAELKCSWVTNDWDSIIPNLLSGNYDTIMAGMSITPDREDKIAFTQDYYPPTPSAYAAVSADVDLSKAVVAAQIGTLQAVYVASQKGETLVEYATADEAMAAVQNGEADAVFADKDFLVPYTQDSGLQFVGQDVILGKGIGMGLRKSDTALKAKFDAQITAMKADGSLNTLLKKWFGDNTLTYPAN